jgi:hypothetical protein
MNRRSVDVGYSDLGLVACDLHHSIKRPAIVTVSKFMIVKAKSFRLMAKSCCSHLESSSQLQGCWAFRSILRFRGIECIFLISIPAAYSNKVRNRQSLITPSIETERESGCSQRRSRERRNESAAAQVLRGAFGAPGAACDACDPLRTDHEMVSSVVFAT